MSSNAAKRQRRKPFTPTLVPIRRFAAEIGRSPQFVYDEMGLGRLKTILHGGRRFVHHAERDRYVAAVIAASPAYTKGSLNDNAATTRSEGGRRKKPAAAR